MPEEDVVGTTVSRKVVVVAAGEPVTEIVYGPGGVCVLVVITAALAHVRMHDGNASDAPAGSPVTVNVSACAVPESQVAVITCVVEDPAGIVFGPPDTSE